MSIFKLDTSIGRLKYVGISICIGIIFLLLSLIVPYVVQNLILLGFILLLFLLIGYLNIINDSRRLFAICHNKVLSVVIVILSSSLNLTFQAIVNHISNKTPELILVTIITGVILFVYYCILLFVPNKRISNNTDSIN